MFLRHITIAITHILDITLKFLMWIFIARSIFSYINPDPLNPLVRTVMAITNLSISLLRSTIPSYEGIDFSPIIIFLTIIFLIIFLINLLKEITRKLAN